MARDHMSRAQSRDRESSGHSDPVGADLTRALNPLAATLAENHLVNPTIATDPISHFRKSFPCHTSKTPPGVPHAPQPFPCPECNQRMLARRRRACPERSRRAFLLSTINYQLWTFLRSYPPPTFPLSTINYRLWTLLRSHPPLPQKVLYFQPYD